MFSEVCFGRKSEAFLFNFIKNYKTKKRICQLMEQAEALQNSFYDYKIISAKLHGMWYDFL